MSAAGHQSDFPYVPRLFSVLGGPVTRASLVQVQRDVDAMVDASTPRTAKSAAGTARPSSAAPLRRVLEALRTSTLAEESSTTAAEASALTPTVTSEAGGVRGRLMQVLGVAAGSALHRECVLAPRRRILRTVQQLAETVRRRLLPSLAQCYRLVPLEGVDVHVQLLPSAVEPAVSTAPAALGDSGFCAAITVRRLSALEAEAAAVQRLETRYMNVAAQGQTLASALAFWEDVSYGDTPPTALAGYPPLGFEEPASAYPSSTNVSSMTVQSEGRQVGRKSVRSPAAVMEAEAERTPVLLGLTATKREGQFDAERGVVPAWVQPDVLCTASATELVAGEERRRGGDRPPASTALPLLSHPSVGLVAVVYVHRSGVAYVAYPSVTADTQPTTSTIATATAPPAEGAAAAAAAAARSTFRPPVCVLPMLTSTGFTRSLLGLN